MYEFYLLYMLMSLILCYLNFQLESEIFVDHSSAAEIGTSRASMNRTFKTNAAKGVKNHYNEYKEFHQRETEAHICASFMEMSGMTTFDGMKPNKINNLI